MPAEVARKSISVAQWRRFLVQFEFADDSCLSFRGRIGNTCAIIHLGPLPPQVSYLAGVLPTVPYHEVHIGIRFARGNAGPKHYGGLWRQAKKNVIHCGNNERCSND